MTATDKKISQLDAASGIYTGVIPIVYNDTTFKVTLTSAAASILDDASYTAIIATIGLSDVVVTVASIADLRAYTGAFQRIRVLSWRTDSHKGGGIFKRRSTPTTDNGGTIINDANGNSYDRQKDGPVSPYWFGAYGTGDQDDSSYIEDMLTYVASSEDPVDLGGGRYRLDSAVVITMSTGATEKDFAIRGDGRTSAFVVNNTTGGLKLTMGSHSQMVCNGFAMEPGVGGATGSGYGLWIDGPLSSTSSRRCAFVSHINTVPRDQNGVDYWFSDAPIKVTGVKRPIIEHCVVGCGINCTSDQRSMAQIDVSQSYQAKVFNCWCNQPSYYGLKQIVTGAGNEGFTAHENNFVGAAYGILYEDIGVSPNVSLVDNHINSHVANIWIDGLKYGKIAGNVHYVNLDEVTYTYTRTSPSATVTVTSNIEHRFIGGDTFACTVSSGGLAASTYTVDTLASWNYALVSNVVTVTVPLAPDGTPGHKLKAGHKIKVHSVGGGGTIDTTYYLVTAVTDTTIAFAYTAADETGTLTSDASRVFTFTSGASTTTSGAIVMGTSTRRFMDTHILNAQDITVCHNVFQAPNRATSREHLIIDTTHSISTGVKRTIDIVAYQNKLQINTTLPPYRIAASGENTFISWTPVPDALGADYPTRIVSVDPSAVGTYAAPAVALLYRTNNNVANATTTETDLATYDVDGPFYVGGHGIEVEAWGVTANNANAKTIKLYFNGAAVLTESLDTGVIGEWRVIAKFLCRNNLDVRYWAQVFENTSAGAIVTDTDTGVDITAAVTVKITGQAPAGASSDIILQGFTVTAI